MKVLYAEGPVRKEFKSLKEGSVFRRDEWSHNGSRDCLFLKIDNYVSGSVDEDGMYERYPFNAILLDEWSVYNVPPNEEIEVAHGYFQETKEEPE